MTLPPDSQGTSAPAAKGAVVHHGRVLTLTRAEGPGLRSALWVAGCSIQCAGCFNPHLFDAAQSSVSSVESLLSALTSDARIEGVTFLGGEPFDQAPALALLAARIRGLGLSVMTFTGYRIEHLGAGRVPGGQALLDETDLLVDGPFLVARPDAGRPWVGSRNQRILPLTDRYAGFVRDLSGEPDRLEISIAPDGSINVNGWTDSSTLAALRVLLTDGPQ